MNERIRELYNQTRNEISIRDGVLTPGAIRDKFAELIVQECVQRLRQEGELATIQAFVGSTYKYAYMNEAANIVKKHFGVEE
jgi:hypothetical protein